MSSGTECYCVRFVAVICGLQHINLRYAFLGWVIQLPVLSYLIQTAVDVSGGGEISSSSIDKEVE